MSKETIIGDLPVDFVRKMRSWVKSRDGGGFVMTTAYGGAVPSSGYAEASIPALVGEAGDIDEALMKLAIRWRDAVRLFWIYEGNSLRWLGRRLAVNHETAEIRVRHGHMLLQMELVNLRHHYHRIQLNVANARAEDSSHLRTGSVPTMTVIRIRPGPTPATKVVVIVDKR